MIELMYIVLNKFEKRPFHLLVEPLRGNNPLRGLWVDCNKTGLATQDLPIILVEPLRGNENLLLTKINDYIFGGSIGGNGGA